MKKALDWLNNRTGWRGLLKEALYENIPGGSRWRYIWGSTLTFAFFIQIVTGVILWMAYSPSSQTAWESVYFIQNEMWGGWFIRGMHHYTAQAMIILLVLHTMQVVIDGAYKAPREVNFWFGIGLMAIVMGLGLTGYLLPWDQKGFWATKVATNLVAAVPFVGPDLQKILIGGTEYGHQTLTRFFAIHAGVLPGLMIFFIAGHVYLFRRHGITPKEPLKGKDEGFWPEQILKDAVACLAVLAVILYFVIRHHGAPLSAPADPSEQFSAARPEWYYLFLFQLLKYTSAFWGAIVIPGVLMVVVCLMPFFGKWKLGHRFNLGLLSCLMIGAMLLHWLAINEDANSEHHQHALHDAHEKAERAIILAGAPAGIPSSGAVSLLQKDPKIQGARLFSKHCASCHRYDGHDGTGSGTTVKILLKEGDSIASIAEDRGMTIDEILQKNSLDQDQVKSGIQLKVNFKPSAADLKDFASREWLERLLIHDHYISPEYFGGTKFISGKMSKFLKKLDESDAEDLAKVAATLSAQAQLPYQIEIDAQDTELIAKGEELLVDDFACIDCHQFVEPDDEASAPDLTGYGSKEWLTEIIADPAHDRFYGSKNDRMPSFGKDNKLTEFEIGLIVDWLRRDYYEPSDVPKAQGH